MVSNEVNAICLYPKSNIHLVFEVTLTQYYNTNLLSLNHGMVQAI